MQGFGREWTIRSDGGTVMKMILVRMGTRVMNMRVQELPEDAKNAKKELYDWSAAPRIHAQHQLKS